MLLLSKLKTPPLGRNAVVRALAWQTKNYIYKAILVSYLLDLTPYSLPRCVLHFLLSRTYFCWFLNGCLKAMLMHRAIFIPNLSHFYFLALSNKLETFNYDTHFSVSVWHILIRIIHGFFKCFCDYSSIVPHFCQNASLASFKKCRQLHLAQEKTSPHLPCQFQALVRVTKFRCNLILTRLVTVRNCLSS